MIVFGKVLQLADQRVQHSGSLHFVSFCDRFVPQRTSVA
jgi:hypothetical protein